MFHIKLCLINAPVLKYNSLCRSHSATRVCRPTTIIVHSCHKQKEYYRKLKRGFKWCFCRVFFPSLSWKVSISSSGHTLERRAYICMIVIIVLVSLLFLLLVDVTLIVQPVIGFNTVDATQCTRFLCSLLRHIEWHSSVDVFTLSSPLLFCQSYDIPSVKVQSMCYWVM